MYSCVFGDSCYELLLHLWGFDCTLYLLTVCAYYFRNMSDCVECQRELPPDGDFVLCKGCEGSYHFDCSSISRNTYSGMGREKKRLWRCKLCRISDRVAKLLRGKVQDGVSQSIVELSECVKKVEDSIQVLSGKLNEYSSGHGELSNRVNSLEEKLDKLTNIKTVAVEDSQVASLIKKINVLEQDANSNKLVFTNIPEGDGESQRLTVLEVVRKLNVEIQEADIVRTYRLSSNIGKNSEAASLPGAHVAPIVVELKSRSLCSSIVRSRRQLKSEKSRELLGGWFQIFEFLTPLNKRLLDLARVRAKNNNWRFVWFSYGSIKARKEEGARYVLINTELDLEKLN